MNRSPNVQGPNKILVEAMHGIGDTVCVLPMLQALRMSYPEAYLAVIVKTDAGKTVIRASDIAVDEIIVWDVYKKIFSGFKRLIDLRRRRFDTGISSAVTPVKKSRMFMKAIGVAKHIGIQQDGYSFADAPFNLHFVEANLFSVKELCGTELFESRPRLYPDRDAVRRVREIIDVVGRRRRLVGVCIGNADHTLTNRLLRVGKVWPKAWGIDKMKELIGLLAEKEYDIVLIGGVAERPLLDALESERRRRNVFDAVGRCSLEESIALASLCDCTVGIDTGMQHIAAAVGVPTVSVFGPTNPRRQGGYSSTARFVEVDRECKYCYGSSLYVSCQDRRCLSEITPVAVFEAVTAILEAHMKIRPEE